MRKIIYPPLLFLFSLTVYLKTLCPTLYGGDCGELTAVSYLLSIAHPPGYPIWTLLAKLFTYLPVGNVALRCNLLSSIFSALAVVLVYYVILTTLQHLMPEDRGQRADARITGRSAFRHDYIGHKCPPTGWTVDYGLRTNYIGHKCPPTGWTKETKSELSALISALIFALSSTFWREALTAEVYSFNALFFASLLFIILKRQRKATIYYFFAFLYGLSFSHYLLILTFFPAFFYFLWKKEAKLYLRTKDPLIMLFLFLLGASLYSYIPLRAGGNYSLIRFNLITLSSFLDFFKAKGFQEISLDLVRYREVIPPLFLSFLNQFTYLGFLISLLGWGKLFKRDSTLGKTLLFLLLINLIFSLPAAFSFDIKAFLIPTYLIFSLALGIGINFILNFRYALKVVAISLLIILFTLSLFQHYPEVNQGKNYAHLNYAEEILNSVKPHSIIIASNSSTLFSFSLLYLQYVEKKGRDVAVIYGMFLRSPNYLRYIEKRYPGLIISSSAKRLSKECTGVLPEDFFSFYYQHHPLMKVANTLSGGRVTKEILNHYRNLYILEEIIEKNIKSYSIYLLNNEVYETPGCLLVKNYSLIPQGYVFRLGKESDYQPLTINYQPSKDSLTQNIYANLFLEQAKSYYHLGRLKLAGECWRKAKSINPYLSSPQRFYKCNYRGISDKAMKEYLEAIDKIE